MNDLEIIDSMTQFIEEKERLLQMNKMIADTQAKGDVVKQILDELERVTTNEN